MKTHNGNYRPVKSPAVQGYRTRFAENRWIIQLLISGFILAVVWILFATDLPLTPFLRNGVRYLMTTETGIQPVFAKVVRMAAQMGNVEWPVADDVLGPAGSTDTAAPPQPVLILPVSGSVVRMYGWQPDPTDKVQVFHEGIDISAPVGTGVRASAGGTVAVIGEKAGLGRYVLIAHNDRMSLRYAGLASIQVREGQRVEAGQVIGTSGRTEDGKPQVHFAVIVNGRPEDPLVQLGNR